MKHRRSGIIITTTAIKVLSLAVQHTIERIILMASLSDE
jgi:hypothetical protein